MTLGRMVRDGYDSLSKHSKVKGRGSQVNSKGSFCNLLSKFLLLAIAFQKN